MIKEKSKNKEKNKTFGQVCWEYARTILCSFAVAAIITVSLTIRARNEMIKNLYQNASEHKKIDQQIAKQVVAQSNLLDSLHTKNYAVCLQAGNLYDTAGDYEKAEYAYNLAVKKSKPNVYNAHGKLAIVYIAQSKFDDAEKLLDSISDSNNVGLIKCKTRSYIVMGDKYLSIGKTIKAARCYERAKFYYDKFSKKDKYVEESIVKRLVKAYVETGDAIVKQGYNSDAAKYLNKALKYAPDDYLIRYKLAIIYSDSDPLKSVEFFEPLLNKIPQKIDYTVYTRALMKAATILDMSGEPVKAKYYRYKIHSIDLFLNQKVVYKDDLEVFCTSFSIKKFMFKYHLKGKYRIKNVSANDIFRMSVDFVLKEGNKEKERYTFNCVTKQEPLLSNGSETSEIEVSFGKNIFTRKELEQYAIEIYAYKDDKYKTLLGIYRIPEKSF